MKPIEHLKMLKGIELISSSLTISSMEVPTRVHIVFALAFTEYLRHCMYSGIGDMEQIRQSIEAMSKFVVEMSREIENEN